MAEYASSLSLIRLRGTARVTQKSKDLTTQIIEKIAGLDFENALCPSLIQSLCCCIEAVCKRRNRRAKNPVDKMDALLTILASVKKGDLTESEKVAIRTTAEFCLQNGLVKSVSFARLVLVNGFRLVKKNLI
jgi:hypothetical protein